MPRYRISPKARADLDEIWRYLAKESGIDRAERILEEIHRAITRLSAMPRMGHHRDDLPDETFRCWEVKSYLIIYKPRPRPIRVARIVSGYRDLRRVFAPP
jgi:toxin ParE1/3/4